MSCPTCPECSKACAIPTCLDEIVIGDISDTDTLVWVFIENNSTGKIDKYETTTDNNGTITLDITGINFNAGQSYTFWVTDVDASISCKKTITVTGDCAYATPTETTCIDVPFIKVNGSYLTTTNLNIKS